ncbi:sensor histidine kinase [Subsaxibacter sp. CAU 1640]|uniref:tetratricopeptide repeat-containing sensor histidine kinase n=1 Tax=Subsaxibacter sp. CAU 1640 TaxID=2933271 RepID=UPI0020042269|nr:tetratricopeptide repeat protein [Subsaxibacter sp. CAU 1640]MCK7591533.1 sensor histidine kinase [Subsaxibacter sp. CAU 1640]
MTLKHLILLIAFISFGNIFSQISVEKLNDSAMGLYKQNPKQAVSILQGALKKSENNPKIYNYSKNNLAIVYRDLGQFEKSKRLSEESLSNPLDSLMMASAYNNIGACNRSLGSYEEALTMYLKALSIYEKKNALKEMATVNNNIGMVYSYLNINDKAIQYHLKAIDIFEKESNKKGISEAYNNIAIIYANDGDLDKALDYFKYSLSIEEELQDQKGIAESSNNVGAVYYYMQKIDSALVYFKKSASIEKSIGNLAGVSASYNNIAQVLIENERVDESKRFIDSAYIFANESKTAVDIEMALELYSQYYEAKNDTKTALKYYKDYTKIKDSLLNFDTNERVAKLEIEYQTEKKEKEILSQRADLAEKELDLSKKNYYILGLVALAVVLTLLGFLVYNQQKLKNRQLKKENELKDALIKIETQNRLQEQRLRISRDLHDNIGAQLTFIISSLDNLKYGFQLPEKLGQKLKNISEFTTTTIYELRDTIWAMNKNEISLEDLQTRISNFIEKADSASDAVNFQFEMDKNLNGDLKFSSVEGMNIYRIIQEAINNALKYANAKTIKVHFEKIDDELHIIIKDDGVGFDDMTVQMGNGINNMRKRAQELGASITINSTVNQGTAILLKYHL